jgi:hypothetical protein
MSQGNNINTGDQEWQLDLTCSQGTLARYKELVAIDDADLAEDVDTSRNNKIAAPIPDQHIHLTRGLFRYASFINGFINFALKLCGAAIFLYTLLYIFAG